jgi:RHS repeat-associated protein
MQWSVPSEGLGYNRAYTFGYDGLNRLADAKYCGFNGSVVGGTADRYNEHFEFDKMGNITNFVRNGLQSNNSTMIYGKVDDLVLEHTGNQLIKVTDSGNNGVFYGDEEFVKNTNNSGNSCAYDANGNRLYDSNSNVWGIKYNILNLPDAMQFYQGHQTNYTYSATSAKLKVVDKTAPAGAELPVTSLNTVLTNPSVAMTTTTDYVGNIIYENGTLKRILTPVGYWQAGTYYYFLKDHLGSNRVVITGSGSIAESSSYYASGMRFGESAVNGGSVQPYRHTGHEMQEMHGLNWIDNGARFRTENEGDGFLGVDPLAELTPSISPYAYCKGNPVNAIDPTGMYSTQEWMDDNGVTDKDVTNVYKAPNENKENKIEKPEPLNELKEKFLNFFGWDLNPNDPKYRKKLDEGSKNRVKAAEIIDETNKFLIINGVLFFVGEGAAYCIEEFGGAIIVKLISKEAIQAAEQGTTVLGKFPEYMNLASEYGARRFSVPTNIWNKMSGAEQWAANQKFLDRIISRGDKIILSNPVSDINKVTGAFRKELDYLIENGYRLNRNGTQLVK